MFVSWQSFFFFFNISVEILLYVHFFFQHASAMYLTVYPNCLSAIFYIAQIIYSVFCFFLHQGKDCMAKELNDNMGSWQNFTNIGKHSFSVFSALHWDLDSCRADVYCLKYFMLQYSIKCFKELFVKTNPVKIDHACLVFLILCIHSIFWSKVIFSFVVTNIFCNQLLILFCTESLS